MLVGNPACCDVTTFSTRRIQKYKWLHTLAIFVTCIFLQSGMGDVQKPLTQKCFIEYFSALLGREAEQVQMSWDDAAGRESSKEKVIGPVTRECLHDLLLACGRMSNWRTYCNGILCGDAATICSDVFQDNFLIKQQSLQKDDFLMIVRLSLPHNIARIFELLFELTC